MYPELMAGFMQVDLALLTVLSLEDSRAIHAQLFIFSF